MKLKNQITRSFASLLAAGSLAGTAAAEVIINVVEAGGDTVITASGSFNVTDLTQSTTGGAGGINPSAAFLEITNNPFVVYQGISGPDNFGTGGFRFLSSSSGDRVGIRWGFGSSITVPEGYVSGDPLEAEGRIDGVGFTDIGIIPGTYLWTWGAGANADSLTINVGVIEPPFSAPPEVVAFSYDRTSGASEVSIKGAPNTAFVLVRADDLDFENPVESPVVLTSATTGTLNGNAVTTNDDGNATVQIDLGTTNPVSFLRAEEDQAGP